MLTDYISQKASSNLSKFSDCNQIKAASISDVILTSVDDTKIKVNEGNALRFQENYGRKINTSRFGVLSFHNLSALDVLKFFFFTTISSGRVSCGLS
jgi:hypothetical protein